MTESETLHEVEVRCFMAPGAGEAAVGTLGSILEQIGKLRVAETVLLAMPSIELEVEARHDAVRLRWVEVSASDSFAAASHVTSFAAELLALSPALLEASIQVIVRPD